MPDATPTCPVCQKPATKRCSKCRAVSYCSFACQKHAWPEHKVVCGWTMEEPEEEEKKDDAFASFVKMRQEQRKKQEEAKEKIKDEITELLAGLVGTPKDPMLHFQIAFKYLNVGRKDEAVESFGKSLDLLMSTSPNATLEAEALRLGPQLLQSAIIGRGEANYEFETGVAEKLVELAEKVGPSLATLRPLALSHARRAHAAYLARRRLSARAIEEYRLADAAAKPNRDLKALKLLPDLEMAVAHENPAGEVRSRHADAAVAAAREAVAWTPVDKDEGREALDSRMLLARIIYGNLCLRAAPAAPLEDATSTSLVVAAEQAAVSAHSAALRSEAPGEANLKVDGTEPLAVEAFELAVAIERDARAKAMEVHTDLASLLMSKLRGAGLEMVEAVAGSGVFMPKGALLAAAQVGAPAAAEAEGGPLDLEAVD